MITKAQRAKALLNELEASDVHILWNDDYYDGPLSGLMEYRDQKYYFNIVADNADDYRKFNVYHLTKAEIEYEIEWHELFEKLVHHGSKDTFNEFYERRKKEYKKPYLTEDKVIGYFYY